MRARAVARTPSGDELSTAEFFGFWAALGESSPPDIGLRLARETSASDYDLASLAALHSPDVSTALAKLARYKRLCAPKDLAITTEGDEVAIHTDYLHADRPPPPRLVDATLASMLVLLQRGTGSELAPKRIELARPRADEPMLMRFFGCPIRFRAGRDAMVFPARELARPFVTHHEGLLAVLVPSLDQQLAPLEQDALVERVRRVIARRMTGERPSVAKVARELALSPRTLQRRLGEQGLTYQNVLDEVRHHAALRLLRTDWIAMEEVAFLLGFEESNSFVRAFRTWEGTTPTRWRDAMG